MNEKVLFLPLYFALSIYIFVRFVSSHLYTWLLRVLLFGGSWKKLFIDTLFTKLVGLMMRSMDRDIVGDTLSEESIIGVFFSLKLIWYESNIPSNNKYA